MTTNESDAATTISKQSANVWWSANLGRPAWVPSQSYFQPRELTPPPQAVLPTVLAVLGVLFSPFAWMAWAIAAREIRRIDVHRRDSLAVADLPSEGAIRFARGLAATITLAPLVFAAIVIVVVALS